MIPSGTTIYEFLARAFWAFVTYLVLGGLFVLLLASAISAQGRNCADRADVIERLAGVYGESRQSMGLGANNTVVEMFANLETGTWTATVTMPNGVTCLVASGQAFELVREELTPTGVPL